MSRLLNIAPITFVAAFYLVFMAHYKGQVVVGVALTLVAGAEEAGDQGLLGSEPDYRLVVEYEGGSQTVDATENTEIGSGMELELETPVPLELVSGLRLVDRNVLRDQTVEQVEVSGTTLEGSSVRFELMTETHMGAGLEGVLGTISGLLAATIIAVGAVVASIRRLRFE